MALPDGTESEPPSARPAFWRRILGRQNAATPSAPTGLPRSHELEVDPEEPLRPGATGLGSRRVVTGLPRAQTFKRQQSEQRVHLAPVIPTADERRAASVDKRSRSRLRRAASQPSVTPRASAPGLLGSSHDGDFPHHLPSPSTYQTTEDGTVEQSIGQQPSVAGSQRGGGDDSAPDLDGMVDAQSMTTSQHEAMINDELERTWILNLSMHFRDRSKREKFFVTFREKEHVWRRVTISLDYRYAPPNSLEMDLIHTRYQREKSSKIYEAIRESLPDIKFYDTVTNLKLETTDGRLHVHVVEDGNEIINYPHVSQVRHLGCRRVRERDIAFDSHMSGFVYKVCVHGHVLIKKEIPSQDTIEEFLYEVNALNSLRHSHDVVRFYGVVVDDNDQHVKGLLISYASQGALIDIVYENCKENNYGIPWATKERWARQIVRGLADIHDSGFVQGDFTLSNIVIDDGGNAKIIDINRRGCPVGWEPPEATALIEAGHRITMYIGVKSDLYQLGMVLWGLAMEEDEPEAHGRPLMLGPEIKVPDWYRQMTEVCLSADPRMRLQASSLLQMFPTTTIDDGQLYAKEHTISVDDGNSLDEYLADDYRADGRPLIKPVEAPSDWPYSGRTYVDTSPVPYEQYHATRGRSPPSPLPSDLDICELSRDPLSKTSWAANRSVRPSYTDVGADEMTPDDVSQHEREHETPTPTAEGDKSPMEELLPRRLWEPRDESNRDAPALTDTLVNHNKASGEDAIPPEAEPTAVQGDTADRPQVVAPIRGLARERTAINTTLLDQGLVLEPSDAAIATATPAERAASEPVRRMSSQDSREEERLTNTFEDVHGMTEQGSGGDGDDAPEAYAAATGELYSKPREQTPAIRLGGQGTEPEPWPDYVATQAPGSRATGATADKDRDTGGNKTPIAWTDDQAAPAWEDKACMTTGRLVTSEVNGSMAAQPQGRIRGLQQPDYPRQMSLPVSLTGIGAAHMGIDDELMREKGIIDDDFGAMVRPATVSTLMITTDSRV